MAAERMDITNLIPVNLYKKTFSTGSVGFHGQVVDPSTGKKYQITAAVEVGSKPKEA